jgi:hypothetical protein
MSLHEVHDFVLRGLSGDRGKTEFSFSRDGLGVDHDVFVVLVIDELAFEGQGVEELLEVGGLAAEEFHGLSQGGNLANDIVVSVGAGRVARDGADLVSDGVGLIAVLLVLFELQKEFAELTVVCAGESPDVGAHS